MFGAIDLNAFRYFFQKELDKRAQQRKENENKKSS